MKKKIAAIGEKINSIFQKCPLVTIKVPKDHPLILVTASVDWEKLIEKAKEIRRKKLKMPWVGRSPHLRQLIGAVILRALKKCTLQEAMDLMRNYAPARILCGLINEKGEDSGWTPDFRTVWDFEELLGADGVAELTADLLRLAKDFGFTDSKTLCSDTTAQEASIPYPTEVGLMHGFSKTIENILKTVKEIPKQLRDPAAVVVEKIGKKVREYRLFAKNSGKKTESHQVAPEADEILARHGRSIIHRDEIHGSKALGKGKTRSQSAGTAAENGYKAHAASQIFYQKWQAYLQQDHLAFSPRGAINCTRKEWKESRIRPEMAGESSSGWLCLDSYPFIVKTTVGFRLCSSSNQRTYRFIWRAAEGIRIRSRSMEPTAHSTNQGQRGKKSSDCSERKSEMEGFRSMQKANDTGARAGRGLNWMLEEDRLQQAPYKKYTRNVKISSKNSLAIKFDEFSQRYGNCNGSVRAIGTFIEMPVILTSNP